MTDCIEAEIRDALPDLVHGRLSKLDRATLGAHVETCADCRAEVELLNEVRSSAPLAPRIDVQAIVAALPKPIPSGSDLLLSRKPEIQAPSRVRPFYKWATAAVLLVAGSLTYASVRRELPVVPTPASSVASSTSAPSSNSSPAVTAPVTASAAAAIKPAEAAHPVLALSLPTGVQDLTDDQLQTLLNDLDKVEGLPNVEPETVSLTTDDEGIQ